MYNPEYANFYLNPSNSQEQKKFHDFRNADCVRVFKYQGIWNANCSIAMLCFLLYHRNKERVVYLLLDTFILLVQLLLEHCRTRWPEDK